MAVFGLKYYAEMRSKYQGITWRCDIAQRGYTGSSEEMTFSGVSPIKITWERRGDDFYTPVKASEANINILCTHNFHYLSLFTSDPREYRMSLYRNGTLFWRVFITAVHRFWPSTKRLRAGSGEGAGVLLACGRRFP